MLGLAPEGAIQSVLRGSGSAIRPLDGLSPAAAWSFGRQLLSAYGGSFYNTTSGVVDTLYDQSGNGRDLTQATVSARPTPSAAGPNNRACGDFDGVNDALVTVTALSNFISASAGYVIASIFIDTFPTNDVSSFNNSVIWLDIGKFAGMTVRSGNILYAYNWDGNEDKAQGTTNASTAYVVEWRHDTGNLYQRVNGAGETSVASGNTSTMTNGFTIGGIGGNQLFDGKIFEMATFSTVPGSAARDSLVTNFKNWIGA